MLKISPATCKLLTVLFSISLDPSPTENFRLESSQSYTQRPGDKKRSMSAGILKSIDSMDMNISGGLMNIIEKIIRTYYFLSFESTENAKSRVD